jgi:bifunctional DNase/RNase
MSGWTDELKAQAIKAYQDAEPTAENSMEIVAEIAENMGQSVNGVRMILSKADVYVKKAAAKGASTVAASGDKPARVSKEAAHGRLTTAITDAGQTVDSEIISKLTGKAAMYFAELVEGMSK